MNRFEHRIAHARGRHDETVRMLVSDANKYRDQAEDFGVVLGYYLASVAQKRGKLHDHFDRAGPWTDLGGEG